MSETYCGLLNVIILGLLAASHGVLQARMSRSSAVQRGQDDE